MDNKYEYDEDEDFWYNQDNNEDEIIEEIEDIEDEEQIEEEIPKTISNTNLDFTQELPDVFKIDEPIIEEPIEDKKQEEFEPSYPKQEETKIFPTVNIPDEEEVEESKNSFFDYSKANNNESQIEEPVNNNTETLSQNTELMPEVNKVQDLLAERLNLPEEDEEEVVLDGHGNELKVGIIILIVLVAAIFGLPWLYSLLN